MYGYVQLYNKLKKCNFFVLVRGCRPGKPVHMTEAEVRGLCLKSREIFLQQPILLELEAPLKICGKLHPLISVGVIILVIQTNKLIFHCLINIILSGSDWLQITVQAIVNKSFWFCFIISIVKGDYHVVKNTLDGRKILSGYKNNSCTL